MEKFREDYNKGWEDLLKCKPNTYEKLGSFIMQHDWKQLVK